MQESQGQPIALESDPGSQTTGMALARIERTEEGECITRLVFPSSPSAAQQSMTITVNDQLTIGAGDWQECVEEDQTPYRLISPPANRHVPYRQALSYVEEATKDMGAPAKSRLHFGEVASATVAVCLHRGSYLAVLTRHDLSQWTVALDPGVNCIGDGEMALINAGQWGPQ